MPTERYELLDGMSVWFAICRATSKLTSVDPWTIAKRRPHAFRPSNQVHAARALAAQVLYNMATACGTLIWLEHYANFTADVTKSLLTRAVDGDELASVEHAARAYLRQHEGQEIVRLFLRRSA